MNSEHAEFTLLIEHPGLLVDNKDEKKFTEPAHYRTSITWMTWSCLQTLVLMKRFSD